MSELNEHPIVAEELAINYLWNLGIRKEYLSRKSPINKQFVMVDGPPFATGLPHHGHFLAGSLKDVIMRYMTMQGYEIEKRASWDTHGVPMEMAVNKRLNINSKEDIEKIGIAEYCKQCKSSVLSCAEDWKNSMNRYGRWADFENSYTTMDLEYMETVWKIFSNMYDQNYIDQGYRICAYSPKLETSLSNFESSLDYQIRNDQSITVRFKLIHNFNFNIYPDHDYYVAVMTTTPWTLPGNMAIAINKNKKYYGLIENTNITFYVLSDDKQHDIIINGSELLNLSYIPLFNLLDIKNENMFKIYHADFVDESGTGAVHICPIYGEDDYNLCIVNQIIDNDKSVIKKNDYLDSCCNISVKIGLYFDEKYEKTVCYQFNNKIIKLIQYKLPDNFIETKQMTHLYPHCWRTHVPLVYRAISSWYVSVSKFKYELVELNKQINWYPSNIGSGRFNEWLANARDWNISRSRYWGIPIPVWMSPSGKTIVVKSAKHLEELCCLYEGSIIDLHRDKIDQLVINYEGEQYKRIDSVFDCWYESGAAVDYLKEEQADFIAEGLDQTRGWFYTLLVEGFVRNKKPAFKNVVVNGLILGNDGKKMSKSEKNYTEPLELINKYGADAFRLYLLSSSASQGLEFVFKDDGVKEIMRTVLIQLRSAVDFYLTYEKLNENLFDFKDLNFLVKECLNHRFNIWILHKIDDFEKKMHNFYKTYQFSKLVLEFQNFIEILNNTYIKLNRDTFKNNYEDITIESISVLGYVLIRLSFMIAPIAPYMAEYVYRQVRHLFIMLSPSIHLCYYSDFYLSIATNTYDILQQENKLNIYDTINQEHIQYVNKIDNELKLLNYVRKLRYENNLPKTKLLKTAYYITDEFTEISNEISREINTLDIKIFKLSEFKPCPIKLVSKPVIKLICQTYKKEGKIVQDLVKNMSGENIKLIRDNNYLIIDKYKITLDMIEWLYDVIDDELLIAHIGCDKTKSLKLIGSNFILYLDTSSDENLININFVQDIARKFQNMRKEAKLRPWDDVALHLQTDNKYVLDIFCSEYINIFKQITNKDIILNDPNINETILQISYKCTIYENEDIEVKLAIIY